MPIGKGEITQAGNDLTIITYGLGVHWAKKLSSEMPHIDIEIIDLIWLQPFDKSLIFDSVRKTGKVLIMHEDTLTGGIGGEIAALIAEHCFQQLDAPVMRAASLDTPIPFAAALEDNFFQLAALKEKLTQLFEY